VGRVGGCCEVGDVQRYRRRQGGEGYTPPLLAPDREISPVVAVGASRARGLPLGDKVTCVKAGLLLALPHLA
jgi:hypothetical protein